MWLSARGVKYSSAKNLLLREWEVRDMMKKVEVFKENDFDEKAMKKLLVHDSPYFKILNFNFRAGQELPIHSH